MEMGTCIGANCPRDSPGFKSFVLESLMTYNFPIVCPDDDDDAGPGFMQLC